MEHRISLNMVPEFQNLRDRVYSTENSVCRDSARVNTLEYTLNNLSRALEEMSVRFSDMEANLNALSAALSRLDSQLRPETDVASVDPKEKSDLEILKTIDDNPFIDLEKVNETKLWEPYDEDWWNK